MKIANEWSEYTWPRGLHVPEKIIESNLGVYKRREND